VILERSNSCHKESPASEKTQANPSSGRWNYGQEFAENFAESGDFHFWVLLHAVNLRHGLYFPSEGRRAEDLSPEKSDGFGRGYQRPARSPLDHRSR